jgi:hypothetical protein
LSAIVFSLSIVAIFKNNGAIVFLSAGYASIVTLASRLSPHPPSQSASAFSPTRRIQSEKCAVMPPALFLQRPEIESPLYSEGDHDVLLFTGGGERMENGGVFYWKGCRIGYRSITVDTDRSVRTEMGAIPIRSCWGVWRRCRRRRG